MQLNQIETLLLQEMEEVKGGRSGTCRCETGAYQSTGDGVCECTRAAALQKILDSGETCICSGNGAISKTS